MPMLPTTPKSLNGCSSYYKWNMDIQDEQDKNLCSFHFRSFVERRRQAGAPLLGIIGVSLTRLAAVVNFRPSTAAILLDFWANE
jgi:hypothetical protein